MQFTLAGHDAGAASRTCGVCACAVPVASNAVASASGSVGTAPTMLIMPTLGDAAKGCAHLYWGPRIHPISPDSGDAIDPGGLDAASSPAERIQMATTLAPPQSASDAPAWHVLS